MKIDSKRILEDINDKIRKREIFKLNREFLIKSLIKASNKAQVMSFVYSQNIILTNQVIEQFRAILKFIHSVDNEAGEIPSSDKQTIAELNSMIFEFVYQYTPIRNYLDQCILGTREIKYDENKNVYYEENFNDYSNYARVLDKVKEYPNEDIKRDTLNSVGKYLSSNNFKPSLFKDRYFYGLMNNYREICRLDSEIKFDHDFGDFTYEDLISFCAALKLMADYYSLMIIKRPCPSIEYESLVYGISNLTNLSKEKVKMFLKYQTYDYDYQKDKLSLIQALIRCGDSFYFYPTSLSIGMLPVKMYRLIVDYDKEKYKKDISVIANQKEKQMTEEIVDKLKKYKLKIELNYRIKKENKDLAEYDMLAFDNKTNNLYICEFKWYFIGDGEKEHKRLDDKIGEAIEHRKEKNKYILDNPQVICDELFDGKKINKVYEILVSQNFSGNTKHDMTVIDFETLQWSVDRYEYFEELMAYFLTDEYRKSIPVDNKIIDAEIEGFKFSFYRMVIKQE